MNAARYGDAKKLFDDAWCACPLPLLRHGMSSASLHLGQCDDALRLAQLWLDGAGDRDREEAQSWLAEVNGQCVQLDIQTIPAGATLYLDGSEAPLGTSPWHGRLLAGTHSVLAQKAGFPDVTSRVPAAVKDSSVPPVVMLFAQAATTAPSTPPAVAPPPAAAPPIAPAAAPVQAATPPAPIPTITVKPSPTPAAATAAPLAVAPKREVGGTFIATWATLGLAAVAFVVGGIEGGNASHCPAESWTPVGVGGTYQCQSSYALGANISYGIAGAAALTSGILLFTWLPEALRTPETPRVALQLGPSSVAVNGRF